jgi:anti-sigma B factor antagonist
MTSASRPPRTVRRDAEAVTVEVSGEIDIASAPALSSCLNDCLSEGCIEMTLDMTQLTFIDSNGLEVLVRIIKQLRADGGRLIICNPPPIAQEVLGITGLTPYLEVVTTDQTGGSDDSAWRPAHDW